LLEHPRVGSEFDRAQDADAASDENEPEGSRAFGSQSSDHVGSRFIGGSRCRLGGVRHSSAYRSIGEPKS